VSPSDQAGHLLGAFRRVREEWPGVTLFTVWNLSYTGGTPEMQGFSIIDPDRTPRPASAVIRDMRQDIDSHGSPDENRTPTTPPIVSWRPSEI